jgi:putative membrane protein
VIGHTSPVDHALLALLAVTAVGVYAVFWSRRDRRLLRLSAWSAGIGVLLVGTAPFVERATATSFTWHMVQHLLIGVVAAPLLVIARPAHVVTAGSPWVRVRLHRLRFSKRRAPYLVAAALAVALVYLAHTAPLYDLALTNRPVHDAQHLAFLLSGVTLWTCALGTRPARGPGRFLAGFGAASALTLLSVWLLMMDTPLSEEYVARVGAADALDDQRFGAGLMWVGMGALTMPLLMVAVWRWASAEQHLAERREALAAAAASRGSDPVASAECPATSRSK